MFTIPDFINRPGAEWLLRATSVAARWLCANFADHTRATIIYEFLPERKNVYDPFKLTVGDGAEAIEV